MWDLAEDASGGVNSFIEEQKALGGDAKLTLVDFDDEYRVVYNGKLSQAPTYKLTPRGSTSLLDAIGKTLSALKEESKKGDNVIVNIITDGHENSSRDWNKPKIKELMGKLRKKGWEFLFLCADEAAMDDAWNWGFDRNSTATYSTTSVGTRAAYASMSCFTGNSRTDTDED